MNPSRTLHVSSSRESYVVFLYAGGDDCVMTIRSMYDMRYAKRCMTCATLQWRQNGHDGVSNHQPYDCLLDRVFRRRSKKTWQFSVTGLCEGNSPVTGVFTAQMASNAENVSIWWRHHARWRSTQRNNQITLKQLTMKTRPIGNVIAFIQLRTLRPRQNGRHFTDDIFKIISFKIKEWISLKISLNYDPAYLY